MRVLLDSCVSGNSADSIRLAGYDVLWVGDWPSDPGDHEILTRGAAEGRVVVTIDKDLGNWPLFKGSFTLD